MKYKTKTMYENHCIVTTPAFLQLTWPHKCRVSLEICKLVENISLTRRETYSSGHKHRHQCMGACVQAGEWW